jgi:hypothetical protein
VRQDGDRLGLSEINPDHQIIPGTVGRASDYFADLVAVAVAVGEHTHESAQRQQGSWGGIHPAKLRLVVHDHTVRDRIERTSIVSGRV